MVHTSATMGTTAGGSKIAGGFVLIPAAALMTAWRACQAEPLGIGDFRAWLACHELQARRCLLGDDRAARYGYAELAKLLGLSLRRARGSVRRLVAAGLLTWSDSAIGFPIPPGPPGPPGGLEDTIGGGLGSLAIPRRMLRFLAAGGKAALIATVLALLLRCLSRRKGGFDGWGRVKASWIARVFGVSIPAVKIARRELIALGWIEPEESSQWSLNRFGRAYRINLGWSPPSGWTGARSIPPRPDSGATSIPPDLHQEPLGESKTHQEPRRGPSGFSKSPGKEDPPPTAPTHPGPAGRKPVSALPAPKLADVQLEDLKNTERLLDLYRQAVARGLVGTSEADRLRFVGAAEHALAIALDPAALMMWLVLNRCWRYITDADEERARKRLRLHDFGPPRDSTPVPTLASSANRPPGVFTAGIASPSRPIDSGELSEDARIVRAIRDATIRAGIYRDPWPEFQARYPEWTRERWERALRELRIPC